MIRTDGITKRFGGQPPVNALIDIDLTAQSGHATALVGPNGAGKTTLVKILSTLIIPTSGDAQVNGYSILRQSGQVRSSIGLVTVSERLFYFRLSALENLVFYASLYNLSLSSAKERALELLALVGLRDWADTKAMHYSTGMLRRLALARALLHDPPVVILDEPTLGIDVVSSRSLRHMMRELAKKKTVLFTSHYMKDIEEIAEKVYLMKEGRLVESGSPAELIASAGKFFEVEIASPDVPNDLSKYVVALNGSATRLRLPEALLGELGRSATIIGSARATLEDVYVKIVGESAMDVRLHQVKRGGGRE